MSTKKSYPIGGGGEELPVHREVHNDWVAIAIDGQDLPNAEGTLWNPNTTDAQMFEVYFYLNNRNAGVVNVTLGRDANRGGGLGVGEYWLNAEPINGPGVYGWEGPFHVGGDDQIRGFDGAAGGNVVSIDFRIKRLW